MINGIKWKYFKFDIFIYIYILTSYLLLIMVD